MATIRTNTLVSNLKGSIGNLVFRQMHGKTILSGKPSLPCKQSEKQRQNRDKFRDATYYAKAAMLDPERKAYYSKMAKKLKLPNAYTAAIADYLRKGEIKEIDTKQFKGKAGDVIRIKTHKKDFEVNRVRVTLFNAEGKSIETDYAARKGYNMFFYKVSKPIESKTTVTIQVMIDEGGTAKVVRKIQIGE